MVGVRVKKVKGCNARTQGLVRSYARTARVLNVIVGRGRLVTMVGNTKAVAVVAIKGAVYSYCCCSTAVVLDTY